MEGFVIDVVVAKEGGVHVFDFVVTWGFGKGGDGVEENIEGGFVFVKWVEYQQDVVRCLPVRLFEFSRPGGWMFHRMP